MHKKVHPIKFTQCYDDTNLQLASGDVIFAMKNLITVGRGIGMLQCGATVSEVARSLGVSRTTVRRWRRRFAEDGYAERRKPTGRPLKTTPRSDRRLRRLANTNRFATCPLLLRWWGERVSRWTITRRLRKVGFKRYRCPVKPFLSPANKMARYLWAQNHIFWQPIRFQRVIWSDESRFRLYVNDGRMRVWRQRGERYRADLIHHNRQGAGGSVHVWGAIWYNGFSHLQVLQRTIDGPYYCEVLTHFFDGNHLPEVPWVFQHDNAPPHSSRVAQQFLANRGIHAIHWPSCSPDLNPIEHVWDHIGRIVQKRNPENLQELQGMIREEWDRMQIEFINNLVDSMKRRIQAVIESNGGNTHY